MSDQDDIAAAATSFEHRLTLHTPVAERLDNATMQQLLEIARGGVGEPEP